MQGLNQWQWAKVLDVGTERLLDDDNVCLAYMRDRIAVSFPRAGVKVWMWLKGEHCRGKSRCIPNLNNQ